MTKESSGEATDRLREGFDDSIKHPEEWESISVKTIIKGMINPAGLIPKSFGRDKVIEWNNFKAKQKEKILSAWQKMSQADKTSLLNTARVKSNLSGNSEEGVKNWNTDDWCRLIHLFSDPAVSAAWARTLHPKNRQELDDRSLMVHKDAFQALAVHFNDYENRIYSNATYFLDEAGTKVCCDGKTKSYSLCNGWNPTNLLRPLRDGSELKEKLRIIKTDFTLAHNAYKLKTGHNGDDDLEGYFYSKCNGDTKLLYCFLVWNDCNINALGKILKESVRSDSGILGEPNSGIMVTPRGKKSRVPKESPSPTGPTPVVDLTQGSMAAAYARAETSQQSMSILMFFAEKHEDPAVRKWSQDTLMDMAVEGLPFHRNPPKRNRDELIEDNEDEEWS
jgi:hypothetical protein